MSNFECHCVFRGASAMSCACEVGRPVARLLGGSGRRRHMEVRESPRLCRLLTRTNFTERDAPVVWPAHCDPRMACVDPVHSGSVTADLPNLGLPVGSVVGSTVGSPAASHAALV